MYNYFLRKLRRVLDKFPGIHLVTREANMVADGLAKWAYTREALFECRQLGELPRSIQKLIFFDRIGLPYVCSKCT